MVSAIVALERRIKNLCVECGMNPPKTGNADGFPHALCDECEKRLKRIERATSPPVDLPR